MASDPAAPARHSPFLFVVGCPRSGTTLLQRMLDCHPDLAVANDTHFIPRVLDKAAPGQAVNDSSRLTADMVTATTDYHRFRRLGLTPGQVEQAAAGATTYSAFVAAMYRTFAAGRSKPLGAEKTPDYVRRLPLLHRLFPSARFLHIHRDGRDVALSILQWARAGKGPGRIPLWESDPLATAALWWRWQVRTGRIDGAGLPTDRYQEVRYEDLVTAPEPVLGVLCTFLDLPFSDHMARFHEGRTVKSPTKSAKNAWLPATPGIRDWRRQMPESDQRLFRVLAGDLLAELGYPDGPPPNGAAEERAEKAKILWQQWRAQRATKERARGQESHR